MQLSFSSRSIKLLYYRYKDSPFYLLSIFVLLIIFSFILFWKVVLPQITNWVSINAEIEATQQRITALNNNITYLSSLSDGGLDDDYSVVSMALPTEKDFMGMLNAVSLSANNAGVALDDYTISFGDLTGKKAETTNIASIKLKVSVSGGVDGVELFLKELNAKLPLSQVTTVLASKKSIVSIEFYYKSLSTTKVNNITPLPKITSEQRQLIDNLKKWWNTMQAEQASVPVGSSSAFTAF